MKKKILIGLFFLLITQLIFAKNEIVRILLKENGPKIKISSENGFIIKELSDNKIIYQSKKKYEEVVCEKLVDAVNILGKKYNSLLIKSNIENTPIKINNHPYQGEIKIIPNCKNIMVINYLDVEEYLNGVIQHEVNPKWPDEVLKAQTIAARTFALFQKKYNSKALYDIKDTIFSQVYNGASQANVHINEIINSTKGEVLFYDGEYADTRYHATCGGYTDDVSYVFGTKSVSYLEGQKCEYCKKSPHYNWEVILTNGKIISALNKNGYAINKIEGLKLLKSPRSNRVIEIEINTGEKIINLKANKFRIMLDPNILRSTFFDIEQVSISELKFKGYGWGHAVGMCQWGAKEMAAQGKSYQEILNYYYPGVEIQNFKNFRGN